MQDFDIRRASLDLVTAFVNNNKLEAAALPHLLSSVFKAISEFETPVVADDTDGRAVTELAGIETDKAAEPTKAASSEPESKPAKTRARDAKTSPKTSTDTTPAVSAEESLADPNFVVSLITGAKFKTLRRHLAKHGLTESEYRARYGLPDDYPFVAPAYSELRRKVARNIARGTKKEASPSAVSPALAKAATVKSVKPKRGSTHKLAKPLRAKALRIDRAPVATPDRGPGVDPVLEILTAPSHADNSGPKVAAKRGTAPRKFARYARRGTEPGAPAAPSVAGSEPDVAQASQSKPGQLTKSAKAKAAERESQTSTAAQPASEAGAKPERKPRRKLSLAFS